MSNATYGEQRTAKQVEIDKTVMERVKVGMARLEREYGPDWMDHIDLDRFNIRNADACVLGQVYDGAEITDEQMNKAQNAGISAYPGAMGYELGRAIIDGDLLTPEGVVAHGFEAGEHYTHQAENAAEWDALQHVWHAEIERQQLERAKAAT